jgi:hypothetical protein
MDNKDRGNSLTANDIQIIKSRIIETCKHKDIDFTENLEYLTQNVNFLFDTNYNVNDISYVVGFIYEEQFYYTLNL